MVTMMQFTDGIPVRLEPSCLNIHGGLRYKGSDCIKVEMPVLRRRRHHRTLRAWLPVRAAAAPHDLFLSPAEMWRILAA